jgi:ATP-dependent 26S proteasome regulatory subunit
MQFLARTPNAFPYRAADAAAPAEPSSVTPASSLRAAQPSFRDTLGLLLKARFPVLYIESFEEMRVAQEVSAVASDTTRVRTPRPVWTWSTTHGLVGSDGKAQPNTTHAAKALEWVTRHPEPAVFIFRDLHAQLGDIGSRPPDAGVVRRIRDIAEEFQAGAAARVLILLSPLLRIPPELEKDITIVDFPLPGQGEIRQLLDSMIGANEAGGRIRVEVDEQGRERLAQAAAGLTLHEAENAFARAMVDDGILDDDDVHIVLEEKRQTIRKSGLLEFVAADVELADVGGLQNLKRWLDKRNGSWMAEAAAYALPAPKGVLMTGVPGCGKSLTAKAVASAWGLPLLRLDIGKVFAGLVGSSEQNMRTAIRSAEATAPCVLWIDEIEKGFSGVSGGGDSGTSSRVFGSLLTWMQEKTTPVFVIATANNVYGLPPEFLRKGRFDEIFFVDLPTVAERRDIWRLHLGKRLRNNIAATQLPESHDVYASLAEATEGFSGAEIEHVIIAGLFDAFAERRPLAKADLSRAVANTVPLSITQAEQISAIRRWAATRAVAATAAEDRTGYDSPPTDTALDQTGKDSDLRAGANGELGIAVDTRPARGGRLVDF